MGKERIRELEILRAVAFIMVIMQHSLGNAPSNLTMGPYGITLANVLMVLAEPAVSMFLFISGLATAYSYKEKLDLKKYYTNRLLYLIVPYFIFSYINMLLYNPDRISNFLWETIAGNGTFHLWYMGMFIRLVLIFPILIYIGRWIHKQNIVFRVITFFIILRGYMYISVHQGGIKEWAGRFLFGEATELQMRFVNISVLFWIFYVILGMYVAFNFQFFKKLIVKYRFLVYGIFIATFYYKFSRQFDFVSYNLLFDILYRTSNILMFYLIGSYILTLKKTTRVIQFISKYSYCGYMLHIFVLYKFIFGFRGMGIDHPVTNAIISCIGATFLAPALVYVISLIPKSKIITGVNDNFNDLKKIINNYRLYKDVLFKKYNSSLYKKES